MTPSEVALCRESIARYSKSFTLASRLLPADGRDDAAAVYAWCRRADDAIDLASPEAQPEALARLRDELRSVYQGWPQPEPTLAAFQNVVQRRSIPRTYPSALLDGMEMDVRGTRYDRLETLLLYCYRVAGTVGLMMCHVMGVSTASALRHAAHLGMAMQLTNICRDIDEDWQRGRLYVPADLLASASDGGDPVTSPERRALTRAIEHLLALADTFYRSGDRGLPALSWRSRLAVRTARFVYSAIGTRIRRRRYDVWSVRTVVPGTRKALLVFVAALWSLVELPRWLLSRFRAAPLAVPVEYPRDVLPI
jgi:phytoene synthase